jgi:hypothetical protein
VGAASIGETFDMIPLNTGGIKAIAAIGAHCDDIVIGAGATLLQIARHYPDIVQAGSPGQIADALTALVSDESPAGWAGYRSTVALSTSGSSAATGRWPGCKSIWRAGRWGCDTSLTVGCRR